MLPITKEDLILINSLSSRKYSGLSLATNSNDNEQGELRAIKLKLKALANYFVNKYNRYYGPFQSCVSSGNPITRGNTFNNVWAGFFKGALNKQYAAQISFVINRNQPCLEVGFYFGRASAHNLDRAKKSEFEATLNSLGNQLSNAIANNPQFNLKYNSLFDFGFTAYKGHVPILPDSWCTAIQNHAKNCQIFARIYPNDFNIIDNSTIDYYVSQLIFFMSAFTGNNLATSQIVKPLTPEQMAKQAERLAQIGIGGEKYIMSVEKEKLKKLGLQREGYPRHVALESRHFGYDILSLDTNGNELYIEVKTTTRIEGDKNSKFFFISTHEYNTYLSNKDKYKLYRVYNLEEKPNYVEVELSTSEKEANGYILRY